MNAMTNVELSAINNVEQLGDFLFSVLPNGVCMYQDISDEIVVDLNEGIGGA